MAEFSIGMQEAWRVRKGHFRISKAILTGFLTLAEESPLAHKGVGFGNAGE